MKAVGSVTVPHFDVTDTATAPAAWASVMAVSRVGDVALNEVAALPPKETALGAVRQVPVTVTVVPPVVGPVFGASVVMVGGAIAGAMLMLSKSSAAMVNLLCVCSVTAVETLSSHDGRPATDRKQVGEARSVVFSAHDNVVSGW